MGSENNKREDNENIVRIDLIKFRVKREASWIKNR